jgi:hypothetical protein
MIDDNNMDDNNMMYFIMNDVLDVEVDDSILFARSFSPSFEMDSEQVGRRGTTGRRRTTGKKTGKKTGNGRKTGKKTNKWDPSQIIINLFDMPNSFNLADAPIYSPSASYLSCRILRIGI